MSTTIPRKSHISDPDALADAWAARAVEVKPLLPAGVKPYYLDERAGIVIYNADCREVLPLLADKSVDLVLTDPPYGVGWNCDYERNWTRSPKQRGGTTKSYPSFEGNVGQFDPTQLLLLFEKSRIILWGANNFLQYLRPGALLIWDKRFPISGKAVRADAECAWMNHGYGCYIKSHYEQGFLRPEGSSYHPTQKPTLLMRWCMGFAPAAKTVLDPFLGSGTTLVACKQLGRRGIGIEIEEKYCEIAAKRLSQAMLEFDPPPAEQKSLL